MYWQHSSLSNFCLPYEPLKPSGNFSSISEKIYCFLFDRIQDLSRCLRSRRPRFYWDQWKEPFLHLRLVLCLWVALVVWILLALFPFLVLVFPRLPIYLLAPIQVLLAFHRGSVELDCWVFVLSITFELLVCPYLVQLLTDHSWASWVWWKFLDCQFGTNFRVFFHGS